MSLKQYFDQATGRGILSTADSSGKVNAALYGKPHFIDEEKIAFIMTGRRTHANTTENPFAVYLFMEDGGGFKGKRVYLKKTGESDDHQAIASIRRKKHACPAEGDPDTEKHFLVYYSIENVRPLVGDMK